MDKADVIRLARECGGIRRGTFDAVKSWDFTEAGLERFAALVRAKVIEEAAREAERHAYAPPVLHSRDRDHNETIGICAAAIRGMKSDSGHSTARAGEASTWQPMEAAPKGERILMLMKHGAIEGQWDGETGSGYYWRPMEWYPSHWMPLPAAPEEAA